VALAALALMMSGVPTGCRALPRTDAGAAADKVLGAASTLSQSYGRLEGDVRGYIANIRAA
jgi:hypothetical protein